MADVTRKQDRCGTPIGGVALCASRSNTLHFMWTSSLAVCAYIYAQLESTSLSTAELG